MQESIQKEKKAPVIPVIALMASGLAVMLVLLLTPWNLVPTQVTENVTVLAVTEYGCVGESELGVSVVVPECSANVGDIITATFNVPAMEQNGYYDRVQERLTYVEP